MGCCCVCSAPNVLFFSSLFPDAASCSCCGERVASSLIAILFEDGDGEEDACVTVLLEPTALVLAPTGTLDVVDFVSIFEGEGVCETVAVISTVCEGIATVDGVITC